MLREADPGVKSNRLQQASSRLPIVALQEAAKALAAFDLALLRRWTIRLHGTAVVQRFVGPLQVVMIHVILNHITDVPLKPMTVMIPNWLPLGS